MLGALLVLGAEEGSSSTNVTAALPPLVSTVRTFGVTSEYPLGFCSVTVYWPGGTSSKVNFPFESVVVFAMTVPFASRSTNTTPTKGSSPSPSLSMSSKTTPVTVRRGSSTIFMTTSPLLVSTVIKLGVTSV